ncbi:sensor histidine kinase [Neobacillus sp. 179-C4.2 HS]|jgi:two-component system, NarL family, sensor histidine kinase YdfH|uniref:histidine kinase n=1 Tax=Neobacillus driksii TaxID=3035913 RepID=A0ABV4YUR3_9BACI|nr:sensor histidine kinase [Neobacillus sp. 179.-C4.2 HS]MDP5192642.1 sensor histidine kinase [Neobacillus sp. 179.-C4.2 HS]
MVKFYNFNTSTFLSDGLILSRIANIFWILVAYVGTMLLQNIQKALFFQSIVFTLIIAIYILLYYFSHSLSHNRSWVYFIIQGSFIFISSFLVPKGSPVILLCLLPVLVAQGMLIFQKSFKILIIFIAAYFLYGIVIWLNYGLQELPIFILVFFINLTIVNFYSVIFNRQVQASLRMEYYLQELETAHQKVEKLTLANERQRMARDLHDTLAQGLAGLIMQLEAVDAHLKNGNTNRSQEIIHQSMIRARETMGNARKVIDDLRTKSIEKTDFNCEVHRKIKEFTEATSIKVDYDIDPIAVLSNLIMEHSLYMISECLTNIAKHAQAQRVKIMIKKVNKYLIIKIEDDGVGFKTQTIGKYSGNYGLLGLNERVRLIGGRLEIHSFPCSGTKISITVPI